jgi:hypothetical protein
MCIRAIGGGNRRYSGLAKAFIVAVVVKTQQSQHEHQNLMFVVPSLSGPAIGNGLPGQSGMSIV